MNMTPKMQAAIRLEQALADVRRFDQQALIDHFTQRTLDDEFFALGQLIDPKRSTRRARHLVIRDGYELAAQMTPILKPE